MLCETLPTRWHELRPHDVQQAFLKSDTRFNIVPAGRRSGKTEISKRRLVIKALDCVLPDARFIASAPTYAQAKRIFWRDLKRFVPKELMLNEPSENLLTITLVTGTEIIVTGLDKPERVEGLPITHIILDEYGNMKPEVWAEHVRPGLSDHRGTADFIGVPEGRNHYYELYCDAKDLDEWAVFEWVSADILASDEIESARRELDLLTFQQEYEAQFVTFEGRVYYTFDSENVRECKYDVSRELVFCFDFNRSPGVAVVLQERGDTYVIGEIYVPRDSNTPMVCRKLVDRYREHKGMVRIFGDATGGAKTSSQTEGSDWDLVKQSLTEFNIRMDVPAANPTQRSRINAMNSRIKSLDGQRKLFVDPSCKMLIRDLEGVRLAGDELDKKTDKNLTHVSDALGYFVVRKHPIVKHITKIVQY